MIEEIGPGVSAFAAGDRIAYVTGQYGGYASERILPEGLAVRLAAEVSEQVAASVLLKGLTAEMLVREVRPIRPGDIVLVHAAAGNVGRLLCQLARRLGATVIGTVGSAAKVEMARRAGCTHTILYRQENFSSECARSPAAAGWTWRMNPVGKDTFQGSLESLALRGHLVNFGQSSGAVEPLEMTKLAARSNSVTRANPVPLYRGA